MTEGDLMTQEISDLSKKQLEMEVSRVALKMKTYYHGDTVKVQHFVRVYTLAKTIGELEKLSEEEQENLELAAVVHNVEGDEPIPTVRDILNSCGVEPDTAMRVCHIVENQSNYEHIGSLDHQIFIEAKKIVEFKELNTPSDEIVRFAEERFITNYGKMFLKRAFNI